MMRIRGEGELDKIHPGMVVAGVGVAVVLAMILSPPGSIGVVLLFLHVLLAAAATADQVHLTNERATSWGVVDLLWQFAIWILFVAGPVVWLVSGRKLFRSATE